jgi:MFS family permease
VRLTQKTEIMQNLQKTPFTWTSLCLPIYLPTLLLSFGQGAVFPILPLYAKSFNVSFSLIGLAVAMHEVGVLIADVPAGILLDRIGRKLSMLIGAVVLGLSMLGIGFAHSFFELIVYQLIGGIGGALWTVARYTYMTDAIPLTARGRSLALFGGINRAGTFLGPAVGGYLGTHYGLRSPFFLFSTIMAFNFLLSLLFIVRRKLQSATIHHTLYWNRFVHVLRSNYRALATAGSAHICAQALRTGRAIIVPLYGSEIIGLDIQAVGLILSISSFVDMSMFPLAGFIMDRFGRRYAVVPCFFIFDMSMFPLAGFIMDRFGRRYAVVPCFFIFGLGMAIVPFTGSFATLLVATIVMGFGNGLGSGTMMTLGADLAPSEGTGEFLGVWRLIGDAGAVTGPLVVGNIAEVWGLATSAFVLAGIGYAGVAIFLWLVPETLRRDK